MYKLLKDAGYNTNVILENTTTKANIILGRISMEVLHILEEHEGYGTSAKDEDHLIHTSDKWDLKISEETGKLLASKVMKMKKPIRDQRKVKSEQQIDNSKIDAMDVLLGLANYNKKGVK